ncbi:hypothetical protein [Aquirufa sp.]|jgi:hypothetical protein|uniref:hypothetical protein n=1 Tax=Aquirufa sp. TaxID=2676249 RepID=UPI0037BFD558
MKSARLEKKFQLFYESPNNVPAPYHLEAAFIFEDFLTENPRVEVSIQYIDRDDFSREELMAEGLNVEDQFVWSGNLSIAWRNRLETSFLLFQSGSCNPRDEEPFITLESSDTTTAVPISLETEDTLLQEFMQAILEVAGNEMPLYLGFQFTDADGEWTRIEGEMSFFDLKYTYRSGGENGLVRFTDQWIELQELMQVLFIGEFIFEKGVEDLKPKTQFAVYPGDGKWYVAGDTWFRPSGNKGYFDFVEDKLRELFTI